jgi:sphingosine kinase
VNPFGGKKSGQKVFLDDVKPFLEDADIQYSVQETKYQLHAKEVTISLDLANYDAIVCVSGDGILVEVVNGLLQRDDWSTAIKTPIGIVPAGTGNGMVKSLLDSVGLPCTTCHATVAIIRGHKRSLDVATIKQGETKFFSVLMLAWGLIADIDIESEKYRWMGKARIEFYALHRVIRLRYYNGRISFVPAPGFENYGKPTSYGSTSTNTSQEQPFEGQLRGYQGPHVNLEKLEWRTINGPFVSIWLHNVPWGAENTMAAPDAKVSFQLFFLFRSQRYRCEFQ